MATLNDNQWELIAKYMVPDCSTEDKAEAEKQAQENPEFGSALDDSLSYWNTAPKVKPKIQAPDLDKQLDKMYAKLASAKKKKKRSHCSSLPNKSVLGLGHYSGQRLSWSCLVPPIWP